MRSSIILIEKSFWSCNNFFRRRRIEVKKKKENKNSITFIINEY